MNGDAKLNESSTALPSSDALSGAMEKLLAHPELISMVASALKSQDLPSPTADKSSTEASSGDEPSISVGAQDTAASSNADLTSALLPMLSKLGNLKSTPQSSPHSALLCALKPYVSPARREAIDYFLKFSQMSTLINGLK